MVDQNFLGRQRIEVPEAKKKKKKSQCKNHAKHKEDSPNWKRIFPEKNGDNHLLKMIIALIRTHRCLLWRN